MSKKDGVLFSKSFFGYRIKDVVEYIRSVDSTHADEISHMNAELEILRDKLNESENKCKQSEDMLSKEKMMFEEKIRKIIQEYDKKIAELTSDLNNQKVKLNDSENRASSYLKIVDSSSQRAEMAETELAVLSASIDDYRQEIENMKAQLAEKEVELKKASEFEILAKKILENNNQKKNNDLLAFLSVFKKSRHQK